MACTIDKNNSSAAGTQDYDLRVASNNNVRLAQPFISGDTGTVCKIDLDLKKTNAPTGNIWVQIHVDDSGAPGAQIGGNSTLVDVSTLGTSFDFQSFVWASNAPIITGGVTYWIVLVGDYAVSATVNASWQQNGDTAFSDGATFDGTSWVNITDFKFRFKNYIDNVLGNTDSAYFM